MTEEITLICSANKCDGSGLVEVECEYGLHFIKCECKVTKETYEISN